MENAYFILLNDNEHFEVSFKYVNKEVNVNKVFTYKRQVSENVGTFLKHIVKGIKRYLQRKKKKEGIRISVRIILSVNNLELSPETVCSNIFQYGNNSMVLKISDTYYNLVVKSPPVVVAVGLPTSILATCPVYPLKSILTDNDQCEFTWLKSSNQKNWTVVGNSYLFTPSTREIDHYLKLILRSEGSTFETVSANRIAPIPRQHSFEIRHQFTKNRVEGKEFRVISYNTLADLYCDKNSGMKFVYKYCPTYALKIDYRKQLLLKEIIGYNADLICLQEVDTEVFVCDFEPVLSHLGYGGNFVKKGIVEEGLAFFFNKARFKQLHNERLVFSKHINTDPQFADIWDKIAKNSKLSQKMLNKHTTLQINVVESLEHGEILVVGNTHFSPFPGSAHIRLLHAGLAIIYLENVVNKLKEEYSGKRISLLFCGDLNSNPRSGIYRMYTTGGLPKNYYEYSRNKEESVQNVEVKHNFQLSSACGTPRYTNYAAGFDDCLDYIFYERSNLAVSQVVPLPSHTEVTRHKALPSIVFPSDHLSLVADLKWL